MDYPFRLPNYRHQQEEWARHRDAPARALLWQMRTGKTKAVLDLACYLWTEDRIDALLVLAPNGVQVNWVRRQLPQHMWHTVGHRAHAWQASEAHRREHVASLEACLSAGRATGEMPVLTVNSESLIGERVTAIITRLLRGRRVMLVVDESHDFRSPGSKRTKRARALAKKCVVRRILSGTSVSNSPLAAFSQYELLEPGALGSTTFSDFQSRFAVFVQRRTASGQSYPALDSYQNLDELQERMAAWSSVVLREDVDDMPSLVMEERTVSLSEDHMRRYREFLKEKILELEDGAEVEAIGGGAVLIKLQQMLSGFVVDIEGQVRDLVADPDNPRLVALLDEVAGSDGKVIVWCKYREDIRRALAALRGAGHRCVEYHGAVSSQADRQAAIDAFQNDPGVRCFVGQPRAGGSGLDLSAASTILWYSHTFDLIERDQANERATQVGGRRVVIKDFVVPGTVDEYILGALTAKRSVSDDLAGAGLRDRLLGILRGQL